MSTSSNTSTIPKQNAARRASGIAHKTKSSQKASDVSDFVKISRAVLEFSIATLQAQLLVLNELATLSDEEKLKTLFQLLDKDKDGKLNAIELADGLRKVRGDVDFEESIALAVARIATFDDNKDATLHLEEFQNFVDSFCDALGCTFHDLSEMLVMAVVFSDTGNTALENQIAKESAAEIDSVVKEAEGAIEKAVTLATAESIAERIQVLFDLFDTDGNGQIDFAELVAGLYDITSDLDEASMAAIMALMVFDENDSKTLDIDQFTKFLVSTVAALPEETGFDDVADTMTRSAVNDQKPTQEDMAKLYASNASLDIKNLDASTDVDKIRPADLARLNRLFDMWDLDKDGNIDFEELTLGLRKFEEVASPQTTVEEAIQVMDTFDTNSDGLLDRGEFAFFVIKFAELLGSDLSEMIDFMIVITALKENTEAEKKYIASITSPDAHFFFY